LRAGALALVVLGLALLAGLAGYLTAGSEADSGEALLGQPAPLPLAQRGAVREISASSLTLVTPGGEVTVQLTPDTTVESLLPATRSDLQAGDWLNVGAIPHARTLFAIVALVIIPGSQLGAPP
jgi:hypothetical protein